MVSVAAQRQVVDQLMTVHGLSQRHACELIGVSRTTMRYQPRGRADDATMTALVHQYAQHYPQHGYRHITALMRRDGHALNHKRVERLWRQEGLQLPRRKVVKRRYGTSTGVKQAACLPNHVWSYDFTEDRTRTGERIRILAVVDEYTRECLLLYAARSIPSAKVLDILDWLFTTRGVPRHLRSDNGPEFIAHQVQQWLRAQHCQTLYIQPGHPWENAYIERFIGTLDRECLRRYLFNDLRELQLTMEDWQIEYNDHRPHSSLTYLTPAEFATNYWNGVIFLTPTGS